MRYQWNDWRPHFGYNPAHWAINHRHRKPYTTNQNDALNIYLVSLLHKKKLFCSGLVINNQTVLTVKSCLLNMPLADIVVQLSDGSIHKAVSSTDSKDYTMESGAYLLSFLHLEKALDETYEKSPPFCLKAVGSKDEVEQWSWDKNKLLPIKKLVTQVPTSQCNKVISDINGTLPTSAMSCVENRQITNKCMKTYGLPYLWKGAFCGMNIFGHNCSSAKNTDVYVRLLREKRLISRTLKLAVAAHLDDIII
ncbi:uncharacterized protein LOC111596160 [Drosophila hydei]|uniref:Uncharacterized protein LOC111596160 n=1 Tax=Drosophila hydei TaxID=7224 RepID=A0A6J1LMK4_DROHY|nr:uncharacterized protein LOC111596160 [Drosophila hydei]